MRYQLPQFLLVLLITANVVATAEQNKADSTSTQQSTEEQDKQNEKLFKNLKSGSFQEREAAIKKIIAAGPTIADKIRSMASDDSSKDFKFRCQSILEQIAENQYTQQIKDFITGKGELPAQHAASWARFQQLVGEPSSETRKQFGAMLQQTQAQELITLHESNPKECEAYMKSTYFDRKTHRNSEGHVIGVEIQMAVAFIASDKRKELENIELPIVSAILRTPNNKSNEMLCKLVSEVVAIEREEELDDSMLYPRFLLASKYQLKEAIALAIQMAQAEDPKKKSTVNRGNALAYLGNHSTESKNLPAIEQLINDDTLIKLNIGEKKPDIRLGDVALAAAVKITQQNIAEYKFEDYSVWKEKEKDEVTAYTGFKTNEDRAAARKRWLEFCKQNKETENKGAESENTERE